MSTTKGLESSEEEVIWYSDDLGLILVVEGLGLSFEWILSVWAVDFVDETLIEEWESFRLTLDPVE